MKTVMLLVAVVSLFTVPPLAMGDELNCGMGYYVMHNKCYEMPDTTPTINQDLEIFEPWISDSLGNEKVFKEGERTFVVTLVRNQGSITHEFEIGMRYLSAETGEWSRWSTANSIVNAGDHAAVILPFLMAEKLDDKQLQVKLTDKYGIVADWKVIPSVTMQSDPPAPVIQSPTQYEVVGVTTPASTVTMADYTIPSWVKGVFAFYVAGGIGDAELIQALEFLISENVIKV